MTREQQDKLRRALYNAKFTTDAYDENPFVGIYFQDLLGIIADYDNNPHWIPVEERLPGEGQVVLGVREGGTDVEMYKFMGFNESTDTFDWEWHPYYRAVVDDVTNWMEIVPPRKEE